MGRFSNHRPNGLGFTLIELLIVVAIIAILAAIAVPNFLEAQTRAKIAKVKANQRTIATALESYAVDANHYPPQQNPNMPWVEPAHRAAGWTPDAMTVLVRLTTPLPYLTSLEAAADPFLNLAGLVDTYGLEYRYGSPLGYIESLYYCNYEQFGVVIGGKAGPLWHAWGMSGQGPDRHDRGVMWCPFVEMLYGDLRLVRRMEDPEDVGMLLPVYDPTNGTVSAGNIARFGGIVPSKTERYLNIK